MGEREMGRVERDGREMGGIERWERDGRERFRW